MSDKKNIDHLFKDAFKDFEASPDPALWDKISDKLDAKETKRKREGIFFLPWLYKAAGIAAAIVVLFFVGNEFIETNGDEGFTPDQQTTSTSKEGSNGQNTNGNTTDSQVTDSNANTKKNSSNNQENSSSNTELKNQEGIANENNITPDHIQSQDGTNSNTPQGNALQNAVATQNGTNPKTNSQQLSTNNRNKVNTIQNENVIRQENAVTGTNSIKNKNDLQTSSSTNVSQNDVNGNDMYTNSVAHNNNSSNKNGTNTSSATTNRNEATKTVNSSSSAVAQNDTTNTASKNGATNSTTSETGVDATTNSENDVTETAVAEVKKDDVIKKSLLDEINDLHDLEKDKTEVAEQNPKRWTISPNASPVYYNTLSSGSPIDETFADNTKSGDLNFSYGVNVGYDVSKRLTVRSGIHKVDYSYSTKDIALVPSINGTELTTIAFKTNGVSFDIQDRQVNATTGAAFSQYQLPSTESSIIQKQIEGNLNQRMSYIEVPVELKYALVDKKLGVNVIGGLSTLLLTENSIILDSQELYAELGEATNLNDVSFSTNIGLGIDYKVSDKIEVNLEPMLKYQLNTFSGNTGNFKPYSVGVYTGVSFRF